MSLKVPHFNPYSPFYNGSFIDDRLQSLRQKGGNPVHSSSSAYSRMTRWTDDIVKRLDIIDILGGRAENDDLVGHSGCVNALAWSQDGNHLASGSDDTNVVLWKMGSSDKSPTAKKNYIKLKNSPNLCLAQSDVIETGHRANIFSVKWAPNSSDKRLFTCAGDSEMRVFDLTRATSFTNERMGVEKEYRLWHQGQGACTHILRCHTSRAKRISTENSPDIFLSCAEDGEVRQTDLRVPHSCSRSRGYGQGCPKPLVKFQMELYSLSVSKMEPWLFAVAGTDDKVYLLDRRMIPRLLQKEWGTELPDNSSDLTYCVRRFAREPPEEQEDESKEESTAASRRRRRFERAHITAVKIAESNGQDIIASYSGDGIYKFDMKREAGEKSKSTTFSTNKRRKTSRSVTPTANVKVPFDDMGADANKDTKDRRKRWIFHSIFLKIDESSSESIRKHLKALEVLSDQQAENQNNVHKDEMVCVALCYLLLAIQQDFESKGAMESEREDKAIAGESLESAQARMEENNDHPIAKEILPLCSKYINFSHWYVEDERLKTHDLIFEKSKKLLEQYWMLGRSAEGSSTDPIEPNTRAQTALKSYLKKRVDAGAALRARSDSAERSTSGSSIPEPEEDDTAIDYEQNISDDDEDSNSDIGDEDEEMQDSEILRAIEELRADEDEDEEDDEDEDEDEDEDLLESSDEEEFESDIRTQTVSGGNAPTVFPTKRFTGHVNVETVKDCGFIGSNDDYIWSGSDCGHFFIWKNDKKGELIGVWKGDDSVVNVLSQHPTLPICAVSGIDDSVKVFGPLGLPRGNDDSYNRIDQIEEILRKNSKSTRDGRGGMGIGTRSLMRYLAQNMVIGHDDTGEIRPRRVVIDGEEQDCVIA